MPDRLVATVLHLAYRRESRSTTLLRITTMVIAVRRRLTSPERSELLAMALVIVALHVVGWLLLTTALHHHLSSGATFGLGTGVLAYTLGLRHAFDADHLAAIDNTTRKLLHDGGRPLSVGFWFSLGHSSIVFGLAVLLNAGIRSLNGAISNPTSALHTWTSVVGTTISGVFLYAIGIINLFVLIGILHLVRHLRTGTFDEQTLEEHLSNRGLFNRFFGRIARGVDRPWKMYPVGLLFGLGFDTATEVALLVLAGTAVIGGIPFTAILALPILFAAGMCLLDTIDGCFMNFAYDWAFSNPARKIYYNLTMTGLSVVIALVIGTVELLSLLITETGLTGQPWDAIASLNLNRVGFVIVGLFVVTWIVAVAIWRIRGLEEKWTPVAAHDPTTAYAPVESSS